MSPTPSPMYRNAPALLSGLKCTNANRRAVEGRLQVLALCPIATAWECSVLVTSRRLTDRERYSLEGFTAGIAWAASKVPD